LGSKLDYEHYRKLDSHFQNLNRRDFARLVHLEENLCTGLGMEKLKGKHSLYRLNSLGWRNHRYSRPGFLNNRHRQYNSIHPSFHHIHSSRNQLALLMDLGMEIDLEKENSLGLGMEKLKGKHSLYRLNSLGWRNHRYSRPGFLNNRHRQYNSIHPSFHHIHSSRNQLALLMGLGMEMGMDKYSEH
jgi:hypothetical protein